MSSDANTWLVVGLGNPGPGYSGNRHNVGQMVINELAARIQARFRAHKADALVAEGRLDLGGARLILAKPGTFMNLSGKPVAALAKFFGVAPDRVIVIHDDLDLPFDTLKLKQGGGHGGHNGLRDILAALGSPDVVRVRVGIGRPPGRQDAADFVLKDFSPVEKASLANLLTDAVDAVELVVRDGLAAAQQHLHSPA